MHIVGLRLGILGQRGMQVAWRLSCVEPGHISVDFWAEMLQEKLSTVCAERCVTGRAGRAIVTRFPDPEERRWIMSDNACVLAVRTIRVSALSMIREDSFLMSGHK
jgi:hypothetical protein